MPQIHTYPGHRKFVWFTPQRRNPTEYELYTVGQQSSPKQWLHVDWPIRFDDGREPYTEDSTALRATDWEGYRDPTRTWYRPYVVSQCQVERTLDRLVPAQLEDAGTTEMNPAWARQALGTYYMAWPFVEYGLFLGLCYAVGEALSDTVEFMLAFQAADRMRHVQDIVHLSFDLEDSVEGFTDTQARQAWMEDPVLVPTRENVERIIAAHDWGEIVVAINLVFEPLVGELVKDRFFARNAVYNGDPATPTILGTVRDDRRRHREATSELMRFLFDDEKHGAANREIVQQWIDHWTPFSERAARSLRGLFEIEGITAQPFDSAWESVTKNHADLLAELGLRQPVLAGK
ncbi:hypothetical protein TH66_05105 [Carbonactinospora thermoautotrophica]|uniref:propane 2-monooxygenase n=1 Tax=Carbonactinospora thermoautotrophica TaxID=1469144 RepID=A0A132MMW7_9ACTN|nr:hypothetical protein [Carbonactinospora thermoautotrophica]KWW99075.1 Methane monooxygenase component A beta chain [Carbonactinospora thermoautotrophica]KWX05107.1 hypothetical protein TH66_05105 [Carbonactinospora thermoautotrophica]KWX05818.1 hypothetical protein TR74_23450 [Carbonactinospora thermoautotrophica]